MGNLDSAELSKQECVDQRQEQKLSSNVSGDEAPLHTSSVVSFIHGRKREQTKQRFKNKVRC